MIVITQHRQECKSYNTTNKCYWFFDRHMDDSSQMFISFGSFGIPDTIAEPGVSKSEPASHNHTYQLDHDLDKRKVLLLS